jgi:hypothetical protein
MLCNHVKQAQMIEDLVGFGIEVEVRSAAEDGVYGSRMEGKIRGAGGEDSPLVYFRVHGFGKSGHANLFMSGRGFRCHTRYDRVDLIEDLDDLVEVVYDWTDGNFSSEWRDLNASVHVATRAK